MSSAGTAAAGKKGLLKKIGEFFNALTIVRAARRYFSERHGARALALTCHTLFAAVPTLALAVGIIRGFYAADAAKLVENVLSKLLPGHGDLVRNGVEWAAKTLALSKSTNGIFSLCSVLVLCWTVVRLIKNIEYTFNEIWELSVRRNHFLQRVGNYLFSFLLVLFFLTVLAVLAIQLNEFLVVKKFPLWFINSFSILTIWLCLTLFFTVIYIFAHNTRVGFRPAVFGGIFAGSGTMILLFLFPLIQTRFFNFDRIYGGFATIPVFIFWLYLFWHNVLFGSEVCFARRNRDSGRFDRQLQQINTRDRLVHQLLILKHVMDCQSRRQAPLAEEELLRRMRLPEFLIDSEIAELVNKKLLMRVIVDKRFALIPRMPLYKFRMHDVVQCLTTGEFIEAEDPESELGIAERQLAVFENDINGLASNINLTEIGEK